MILHNPFIASKYKSYTRDEVYRFGLIMYNDKNIPSPVHWIGDIRMPHASDTNYKPFTNNESIYSSINNSEGPYTLISHPLGVQFSIANLPAEVKAVEIVRCERTVADKTVLMQGAVSKVGRYKHLSGKDGSDSAGDRDIRPYTYMTYGQHFGSKLYAKDKDWDNHDYDDGMRPPLSQAQSDSYYTLASPEVCVNRENTIPLLNDTMKLDILYGAASPTHSTYTSGGGSKQRIMSYAGTRFDDKNNLITLYPGDSQRIYGTVQEYTPDGSGGVVVPCVMYAADTSDTEIQYADTDEIMKAVNLGYVSKYYFLYRTANIVKKIGGAVGTGVNTDLAKKMANVDKIEYANLLDYSILSTFAIFFARSVLTPPPTAAPTGPPIAIPVPARLAVSPSTLPASPTAPPAACIPVPANCAPTVNLFKSISLSKPPFTYLGILILFFLFILNH